MLVNITNDKFTLNHQSSDILTNAQLKVNGDALKISDFKNAENEISADIPCALICPTDFYAIKLLPIAKKHKSGIIGFDNLRLIDELDLGLDSVAYDIKQTAETAVNFIANETTADCKIEHTIIKRGSV